VFSGGKKGRDQRHLLGRGDEGTRTARRERGKPVILRKNAEGAKGKSGTVN